MNKGLLLLILVGVSSCGMSEKIQNSTYNIDQNREAVENSTATIRQNTVLIRQSTEALRENRKHLEAAS